MSNKKNILGIVPARGGSKGIPGKNIKEFCGKPLMAWTIESALKSEAVSRLIVSTDDFKIAEIAKQYGAEVPFMRPAELAQDASPTLPALVHAVKYLADNENYKPDYVLLLESTSPGRQPFHIKEAVKLIIKTEADSVVSMKEVATAYSPFWQFKIDQNGKMELFTGQPIKEIITRRQELPKTYVRNGSIYLFKTNLLFESPPSIYGDDVRPYLTDEVYSLDIDTPQDWAEAEEKMRNILKKEI